MNKLLVLLLTSIACTANAGNFSFAAGVGQEVVQTTRGNATADLFQINEGYRFDNGVTLSGTVMSGYFNRSYIPHEQRYEANVGYGMKFDKLSPYGVITYGRRVRNTKDSMDYYAATVGTKIALIDNWYGDVAYRYRDTNDATWKTDTYFAGLGYNITPKVTVFGQYGNTTGDYKSYQYSLVLINRF